MQGHFCTIDRTGQKQVASACWLQVFVNNTCHLFDMLEADEGIIKMLKDIMEDENVTKVMHDCRQDSAALFYQFGIKLRDVVDTQVCHDQLSCITNLSV